MLQTLAKTNFATNTVSHTESSVAKSLQQGMTTATRWPNDRRHNMTTLLRASKVGAGATGSK